MINIQNIEITFPVRVNITSAEQKLLNRIVRSICLRYERLNPEKVLWACGSGSMPIIEKGDISGFDDSVYSIICSTRERYESEKGYPDPDRKRGPIQTVGDLQAALCNMPLEAGVFVSYDAQPGQKLLAHEIASIKSVELVDVQELPVDDPLNLTIQMHVSIEKAR